ncbi:MAG: hypothetical protein U0228_10075 [Myxococcaceae bacterium]
MKHLVLAVSLFATVAHAEAPPAPDFTGLRVGGAVVSAAGLALGVTSAVLFAQLPQVQRDANGNVFLEDATKVAALRSAQGVSAAALTGALGFALVGTLMLFARPGAPLQVSLVATPQAGLFALGGRF